MRKFILACAVMAAIGCFIALSWAAVDTVIHYTDDDAFCSRCHSHKPISTSYRASLHGGANSDGWRATCSDCHIPQDNALHYLWVKGVHGVVDPTMELIKDPLDIDWHGNRARRAEYVYDSGCLSCHLYLQDTTLGNERAFLPHRNYFQDQNSSKCVDCHEHVGHHNLGLHLEEAGWSKSK